MYILFNLIVHALMLKWNSLYHDSNKGNEKNKSHLETKIYTKIICTKHRERLRRVVDEMENSLNDFSFDYNKKCI